MKIVYHLSNKMSAKLEDISESFATWQCLFWIHFDHSQEEDWKTVKTNSWCF